MLRRAGLMLALTTSLLAACGTTPPVEAPTASGDPSSTLQAQADTPPNFILFVRGLDPNYSPSADSNGTYAQACSDYWSDALAYFTNRGWGGKLRTIGIYSNENGCYVNMHNMRARGATSDTTARLTNNTSIRVVARRLAWWIYDNYTSKGYSVGLVSHSMGGLIARAAVGASSKRDPDFPPPLLVKSLVLLATPNYGASSGWLGQPYCGQQCTDMSPDSAFLQTLNGSWDTGNSGVKNRWHGVGANDVAVAAFSYNSGVGGGSGTGCLYTNPGYDHGSILTDTSNTLNAQVKCWDSAQVGAKTNLNYIPSTTYTNGSHSLKAAFDWATAP